MIVEQLDWESKLLELGLYDEHFAGIQINNVARREFDGKFMDASVCDHNCLQTLDGKPTGGKYTCPASITLNKGVTAATLAPAEIIVEGVKRTADALSQVRAYLLGNLFEYYSEKYSVPHDVGNAIKNILQRGDVEVNLFGGNPEMHPQITEIIHDLKRLGYSVTLTTTGRRFMYDKKFLENFLSNPPDILALSADDFESVEQIGRLARLPPEDLRREWRSISNYHGQRKKAYEAVYAARLTEFPRIIFNMVLHSGNLSDAYERMFALDKNFSGVRVNPYPAQSAFYGGERVFTNEDTKKFAGVVDFMIKEHFSQGVKIVPRLHYWLGMKSALESSPTLEAASDYISGRGIWRCYVQPGAGTYVQIGASPEISNKPDKVAGGHLGCFWNTQTVTDSSRQVWNMTSGEIGNYVKGGMVNLSAASDNPCLGCAFPRLVFNEMSFVLGVDPKLLPTYHRLRKDVVGF